MRKMDPLRKLIVVAVSSSFLFAKMSVNGTGEPYPTNASVALTEDVRNTSTPVVRYREIFPPNGTSSGDDRGLPFPCGSKTCLSLCCGSGKAYADGNCIEDNHTSGYLPQTNVLTRDVHLLTGDPCDVNWLLSSELEEFDLSANGTIYARWFNKSWPFDFERSCLFRKPNSTVYSAKVCYPWTGVAYWMIIPFIFVVLVMLAIFIGYSVTPELKNLHGMVFRAYLATYICAHLSTVAQQYTAGSNTYVYLFIFFVIASHYGAGACALWFNVMCFNIWRTFRGLRPTDGKVKDSERKKFIHYALYAWLTPAVFHTVTTIVMYNLPSFRKRPLIYNLIQWCCVSLLVIIVVCNAILYTLTAFKIRKHQRDTAHLTNGTNKHHKEEKQGVNLHVKLFMITGCHTISWAIWELWPTVETTIFVLVVEIVQCVLLFYIYMWKDNVKQAFRQLFKDAVCRLQSIFGTSHTQSSRTTVATP